MENIIEVIEEIELTGTEKQIKWAKKIRKCFLENILRVIENKDIEKLLQFIKTKEESEFWINAREMNYRYILYLAGSKTGFEEKKLKEIIKENVEKKELEYSLNFLKKKYQISSKKKYKEPILNLLGLSDNLKIGDCFLLKEMIFDIEDTEEESFQKVLYATCEMSDQKTYIYYRYNIVQFDILILYQIKNEEVYKKIKSHHWRSGVNIKNTIEKIGNEQCTVAYIEVINIA